MINILIQWDIHQKEEMKAITLWGQMKVMKRSGKNVLKDAEEKLILNGNSARQIVNLIDLNNALL